MSQTTYVDPKLLKDAHPGAAISLRDDSDELWLLFTGRLQQLMINPPTFLRKTGLFSKNLIMFRDLSGRYYQYGISPMIDSFDKLLAWQRAVRDGLPHIKHVCCVGTSMGGYAAVQFGYHLRADAVWAFAPQTVTDNEFGEATGLPLERRDLAALLAIGNGVTRFNIYYNEQYEPDRLAALRLRTHEGVKLWPQSGEDGHSVVTSLLKDGQLEFGGLLRPPDRTQS